MPLRLWLEMAPPASLRPTGETDSRRFSCGLRVEIGAQLLPRDLAAGCLFKLDRPLGRAALPLRDGGVRDAEKGTQRGGATRYFNRP